MFQVSTKSCPGQQWDDKHSHLLFLKLVLQILCPASWLLNSSLFRLDTVIITAEVISKHINKLAQPSSRPMTHCKKSSKFCHSVVYLTVSWTSVLIEVVSMLACLSSIEHWSFITSRHHFLRNDGLNWMDTLLAVFVDWWYPFLMSRCLFPCICLISFHCIVIPNCRLSQPILSFHCQLNSSSYNFSKAQALTVLGRFDLKKCETVYNKKKKRYSKSKALQLHYVRNLHEVSMPQFKPTAGTVKW